MERPLTTWDDVEIRALEDATAEAGNTIDLNACRDLGVKEEFLKEWSEGVILEGCEHANPFFLDDYPALKDNARKQPTNWKGLQTLSSFSGIQPGRHHTTLACVPETSF